VFLAKNFYAEFSATAIHGKLIVATTGKWSEAVV
jgi:hypothetical protein